MTKINGPGNQPNVNQTNQSGKSSGGTHREKTKFGKFMSKVGDAALATTSAVAPALPGGQLIKAAADGLQGIKGQTPGALANSGEQDQINDMFEMQKQNQMMNMQYMQLQQQAQAQNRQFKTMSNLMKVRHDTAKSAINNMRA